MKLCRLLACCLCVGVFLPGCGGDGGGVVVPEAISAQDSDAREAEQKAQEEAAARELEEGARAAARGN